uniref:RING-type E3 ubiquitin transferase n=1 Tax=Rhabditophanes sp. KR3021 TaxID=114890 RepID=A0AC35TT50_9BILA
MGKKQHQKDKLYLTTKEWKDSFGGNKDTFPRSEKGVFRRLPFTHCSLTLVPYEKPCCSKDGYLFDYDAIIKHLEKKRIHPCTGKKMTFEDIIELHFAKNKHGKEWCPINLREFGETSYIVAIGTTGNVYSKEAVDELNLKINNLKDLTTEVPFQRKDIIVLQDPTNLAKFNLELYYHVKDDEKLKAELGEEKEKLNKPEYYQNCLPVEAKISLALLEKEFVKKETVKPKQVYQDKFNSAHYSEGKMSAGFTSTACDPVTQNKAAVLEHDHVKYSRVVKNGYVRILTNYGTLNLELFCKAAPMACENFLKHCEDGYFNNTIFHRVIKNFMMQGGDPTGTGKGGESIWGKTFKDEIGGDNGYIHDSRGFLSMANHGSNTNKSQFFITFRPCAHLNGKHTIFGKVVGGLTTLDAIEAVETDTMDKPIKQVQFISVEVFGNPIAEAEKLLTEERFGLTEEGKQAKLLENKTFKDFVPKTYGTGVGKYIKPSDKLLGKRVAGTSTPSLSANEAGSSGSYKKKPPTQGNFSNFSSWD